ncbi:hypothetical protein MMC08_006797 [Hypocenomyce scalaris]|nr:hypothetical protein [Hypocenomyce scalaris]
MRAAGPSTAANLALYLTLSFTAPVPTTSMLARRSQFCTNAPTVTAGSTYVPKRRHIPSRGNPIKTYWCAPGGQTYIVFHTITTVAGPAITNLLQDCSEWITRIIANDGDQPIHTGSLVWGSSPVVVLWNANNHQLTYGVAGAAIAALRDYMMQEDVCGSLSFDIWDGANQVGAGLVAVNSR